ncbi:hypothetical protein ACFCQI_01320 [Rhodanobacter sp. FW102-FHT14D06]|uniref:Aminoglycoside phosphotransferase domain-containing protein n=2 Tax=unclassified Rhodanobacter TaxID=2621553 RepID=A0AB74URR1_9GAMM
MNGQNTACERVPPTGSAGWLAELAFTPRKESWVASSADRFYKIFRRSDDPLRDWLDPTCMEKAGREYADALLLRELSEHVCTPLRLDHACVVYPRLSGPDLRPMLQQKHGAFGARHRAQALRKAMVVLAQLHRARSNPAGYPAKDYLHNGYLVPDAEVARRIGERERTLFIGGFEVRNFRYDEEREDWLFFDPQHVYLGMPEDDVARFVISLLMINWGQGGGVTLWQGFDVEDLLAAYEDAAGFLLDGTLLTYFLRETIAMRRHFAQKALRNMAGARRVIGRPYLAGYFMQLNHWAANHEF